MNYKPSQSFENSTVVARLRKEFPSIDWRDGNHFRQELIRVDGYAITPVGEIEVFRVYFKEDVDASPGYCQVQFTTNIHQPFKRFDTIDLGIEFMKSISFSLVK